MEEGFRTALARASDVVQSTRFQEAALRGANSFFHRVILIKAIVTILIFVAAIAVSVEYARQSDPISKNRIRYFADMWVGKEVGLIGATILLWLPTLLFLVLSSTVTITVTES